MHGHELLRNLAVMNPGVGQSSCLDFANNGHELVQAIVVRCEYRVMAFFCLPLVQPCFHGAARTG